MKKLLSVLLSLAMVMSLMSVPQLAMAADAPSDEIVSITFDETGTGSGSFAATRGGTVTEHGTVAYADSYDEEMGKALNIASKSASNYLELADGVLSGYSAATYSFWFKATSGDNPNWPFMTTCEDSHTVGTEKYLGLLATTGAFTMERYNNNGSRLSSITASSDDDWNYVVAVYDPNGSKLYVNGQLAASDTVEVNVAGVLTATSKTWIGHANWGDGEGFSGLVDDFKIFGRSLDEDEITALSEKAITRELTKNTCLKMSTDFYKGSDKVFQIKQGETVTVKTTLTNYFAETCSVAVDVLSYDSDGKQLTATASSPVELAVLGSKEFSYSVTADDKTAYYKVNIKCTKGGVTQDYDGGYLPVADVSFPDASPADSADTTEGAHDPTIFKDPVSGKYYAYSTHNLVFESSDLITWKKYDYTADTTTDVAPSDAKPSSANNTGIAITVPESAYNFIKANYSSTTPNGTYWAPDIYYKEGDDYPYWFYLSTSCGLGGRNSVISLIKAKSPGLWDDEYQDAGVVFASKENSNYNTNSIDANIFTDSDGKTYFIWGSFWRGIHMAELDTDTGRVKGVDYTSDATILSSCQSFGTRMYSTPKGVVGPEGPYTVYNEDTGYRYMFTSYGWLGTNYNIRVARTNKTFSTILSGTDPHKQLLDQKGRPVGATYSDQVKEGGSLDELWGYKMSGSFQLGDGIEYLGSGHNSVFQDDDGQWYLVQHCRKVADAVAYLQVKKMLWTADGWPVVSPLVYAGEKEQKIPKQMLYGTWDLSSVGHTIFEDGVTDVSNSAAYKGTDLPVHSSEVILQPDGTLGNYLGTWDYDGDHTVTLNFEQNGDNDEYEFYEEGDTMTLYVLTGYDKDKRESAVVMTGTDQNLVTQFAKKNNQVCSFADDTLHIETTPVTLSKSTGGNPILGFDNKGNIAYGGDPSVLVDGDTVYIYAGHDTATADAYVIPEYLCYSSKDLVNWDYHGSVFAVNTTTVSWASGSTSAWASQVLKHNGKYYLYYCTWGNSTYSGYQCIGVAVSDSPTGTFTNVSETPLINGYTMTTENTSGWNDIDPTGWIETDENGEEHIYLNWGNGENYTCELNDDMVSVKDRNGDGSITSADIVHTTFNNIEGGYTEAPYLYRRTDENGNYTGKYYLFFAKDWREQWAYATTDDIMSGSWDYGSLVMGVPATSNTSHGGVFDFNGKTYFVYHNGSLPWGSGHRRVANIQELTFDGDGNVVPMTETSTGLSGTASYITSTAGAVYYEPFTNPFDDASYPLKKSVLAGNVQGTDGYDDVIKWEIEEGKSNSENEYYVSIQAVSKPGLYLCADGKNIVITQQDTNADALAKKMTFKSVEGIAGTAGTVSFESVSMPGYFITVSDGKLTLTNGENATACEFTVTEAPVEPTAAPTVAPTTEPTTEPSTEPSTEPTVEPTTEPTEPTATPVPVYSVSGVVKDQSGNAVENVTVTLKQGSTVVSEGKTDSEGKFTFADVPAGAYNIVAEYTVDGVEGTTTAYAEVKDADVTELIVTLHDPNVNSELVVGAGTPDIVVDGLDTVAEENKADGEKVTVTLTVESKADDANDAAQTAIKEAAGDATVEFLDIKLDKTVGTDAAQSIDSTDSAVTIIIPFDTEGKSVKLYRYNSANSSAVALKASEYTIEDGVIKVYATSFSTTYGISYTDAAEATAKPSGSGGSSGGTSTYKVTFDAGEHGRITSGKSSVNVGYGSKVSSASIPTITADDGYVFLGWSADGVTVTNVTATAIKAAKTFTALYTAAESTVPSATDKPDVSDKSDSPFTDVSASDWFYDDVLKCYENGIISGVSDDKFDPYAGVTRGMFITFIYRMDGEPEAGSDYAFDDVSADSYYAEAVSWGYENGVINGYSADTYAPDQNITREQMAAIIYRYAKSQNPALTVSDDRALRYTDSADISDYAMDAVVWNNVNGIMTGDTSNAFNPRQGATRAEAAAVLSRMSDKIG